MIPGFGVPFLGLALKAYRRHMDSGVVFALHHRHRKVSSGPHDGLNYMIDRIKATFSTCELQSLIYDPCDPCYRPADLDAQHSARRSRSAPATIESILRKRL
jgi:hypothetical protein